MARSKWIAARLASCPELGHRFASTLTRWVSRQCHQPGGRAGRAVSASRTSICVGADRLRECNARRVAGNPGRSIRRPRATLSSPVASPPDRNDRRRERVAFGTRAYQGASRLLRYALALRVTGGVPSAQTPVRAVSDGPWPGQFDAPRELRHLAERASSNCTRRSRRATCVAYRSCGERRGSSLSILSCVRKPDHMSEQRT